MIRFLPALLTLLSLLHCDSLVGLEKAAPGPRVTLLPQFMLTPPAHTAHCQPNVYFAKALLLTSTDFVLF